MRTLRLYKLRRIIVYAPAILSLIIIGILIPYGNKPDGVEAITDMTGDPSITVTSTNDTANVMIEPTATGAFASTSNNGNIAFSVSTTNYTGYELSARSTKTTLDNGSSSLSAITSDLTEEQFSASSSTTYNNKWGYKPNFYDSTANTKFYGITTTSVVLDVTNEANSTAKDYTIAIGARADLSTPAGSYINDNIILETVANVVPSSNLTVNYGTGVTGVTIAGQTIPDGETVKLIQGVPYVINMTAEEDYAFDSWDATSGTINSTSTQNTTYTIGTTNDTLSGHAAFTGPDIQNLDAENCTTTASRVKDTRDGHIYTIQRLADGKCWMMENLNLGRPELTTDLTSANTNLETTITASTFNGWKKNSSTGYYDTGEFIWVAGTDATSGTPYGILYNYYTASAGTISGSTNNSNASHDICPAGWRLPTGGSSGEFQTLYAYYNSNVLMRSSIENNGVAFALVGNFNSISHPAPGYFGHYWSSTRNSGTSMYDLNLSTSDISPDGYGDRSSGFAIRCVLKKQISDLTYLQDFKNLTKDELASVSSSMKDSTTYNLIDNRDNKTYAIAKLKNGKIWMVENIDLGRANLTTDLSSANTNIVTPVTASTFNGWVKTSGSNTSTSAELIPLTTTNTSDNLDTDSTTGIPYGTLYNYCAASAQTICSNSNENNATYDICPAGWRLPSSNEFTNVAVQYNNYTKIRAPITDGGAAFVLAGFVYDSVPTSQGLIGDYWSSTNRNSGMMYRAYLNTSSYDFFSTCSRTYAFSVRCVAKKVSHTLTISYGEGIANITINGISISDGGTISLEEGVRYNIDTTLVSRYSFASWSATSGNVESASAQSTTYTIGDNDAILTATAPFNGPNIQNLSATDCSTTHSYAKDVRDGHIYIIQRLDDGNCWMMENLDLGRTNLAVDLTSANTNLSTTIAASTFNSWKTTTGSDAYDTGLFINLGGTDYTSGTSYGTLYYYYAASAGTISGNTNSNDASYDICPAGWRLPTGGNSGEFQFLYTHYNTIALMRASITNNGAAFAFAGYLNSWSLNGQSFMGYYWSSTKYDSTQMYNLFISSSEVSTANISARNRGFAIRCILKEPKTISKLTYLQDFENLSADEKASVLASMEDDTTYNLIDNRDNHTYAVAKLKDGNIWMAENLDLGRTTLTTDLTSANTNLSATVTASTFNSWVKSSGSQSYTSAELIPLSTSNTSNNLDADPTSNTIYGTLYNYCAASANTVCANQNTSNAQYDLCPAGWRLPTGGNSGEFSTLYTYYNSNMLVRKPIEDGGAAFALSGYFYRNTPVAQGDMGYYWSSTMYDETSMHNFYFVDSGSAITNDHLDNYIGNPIRCLVK